jgi:signal transduction histidine kinase
VSSDETRAERSSDAAIIELDERRELEREKHALFAAANHELRTPLAAVIAALELLREDAERDSGRDWSALLQLALENAERLERVVEQWLELERVDLGVPGIQRIPFPLAELVAAQVRAKTVLAAARGVCLEIVECDAVQVGADPERLGQALAHLLASAIERSPRGARVCVRITAHGDRALLVIKDDGVDVPSDAGLGLSACRAIVERQRGVLQVVARDAGGAAFRVELPRD